MGLAEMAKGAAARLAAVREAVGDAVDIGLDAHAQAASPLQALELAHALAPYHPLFLEEPLRPENRATFGYLRSKSPVPIATGESMYTRFEFRDLLAQQGADIIQPDITVVGGLWEMRKIAAMAEAEYVLVAPHNPCGPIANAVNLHFCMATPNLLILEYKPDDVSYRRDLVDEPIPLVEGFLVPPARPGLGIDLNLDYVKDYQYRSWHRPFLWRMDGSLGLQ
jgi:galactonate dehydratase